MNYEVFVKLEAALIVTGEYESAREDWGEENNRRSLNHGMTCLLQYAILQNPEERRNPASSHFQFGY